MGEPSDTDSDLSVSERNTTRSGRDFDVCRTGMVAEMQTRLKVNQLTSEIARIEATFKANPITDYSDARVARINELKAEVYELTKLSLNKKQGRRRMGANDEQDRMMKLDAEYAKCPSI